MISKENITNFLDGIVLGNALDCVASSLREDEDIVCLDSLLYALNPELGDDSIDLDEATVSESCLKIGVFLQNIGVADNFISDALSGDDEISNEVLNAVAVQYADRDKESSVSIDMDSIELDASMPALKSGYKRVQVVRGGKKVWINKRNPNKKVRLTPKQKLGLIKARKKAHSSASKIKRARSMRIANR